MWNNFLALNVRFCTVLLLKKSNPLESWETEQSPFSAVGDAALASSVCITNILRERYNKSLLSGSNK